jgi:NAD(P)-dependent dehydrogenase (short-subunit alcohol dehydrogenase family)
MASAEPAPTVLITGAARRIGRAIAFDLAAAGWAVAVHYNGSADEALATAAAITSGGGRAATVRADLGDDAQTAALIAAASEMLGPVSCLINNASVFEEDTPLTATRDSWDRHQRINLWAPLLLTQAFVRQLPEGTPGNVINLIDQRVWRLTPYFTSYTVSKTGLWTLTQTLAMALAPRVRVNAVGPGPTLPSARQSEQQFARQWAETPLNRPVDPAEIARAVRFLLDAPSVTGQMIAVDGGQHLGWTRSALARPIDE